MRRSLLPLSLILATIAVLPRAAEAAVVSTVSADTLNITGDAAADSHHAAARARRSRARCRSTPAPPDFDAFDRAHLHADLGPLGRRRGRHPHRRVQRRLHRHRGDHDRVRRGRRPRARRPRRGGDRRRRGQRPRARRRGRRRAVARRRATTPPIQGALDGFDVFEGQSGIDTLQILRHGRVGGVHGAGRRRRAPASAATSAARARTWQASRSPSSTPGAAPTSSTSATCRAPS